MWKLKRKWSFGRVHQKTIGIAIISFILGYIFNMVINSNLKLVNKDLYFGDSPYHSSKSDSHHVLLVILIFSSVKNINRREMIRNTWLSNIGKNKEVVHLFAVGTGKTSDEEKNDLLKEQDKFNDLLVFNNLNDSFYLLTEKLLASFGWLTDSEILGDEGKSITRKKFRNFEYVLKCDDDSFVRVSEVVNVLKSTFGFGEGRNLYWGFFDGRAIPKKTGKYKENNWKICDRYIPYALGGGYVLSRPLVHFIAKNGDFLMRYNSEDISVGAWLSSYNGLNRVHDPRFDTEYISRGCHQSYLITHKHSEREMKNFHDSLINTGRLCQKEFRSRISYDYDWNVPPSECCSRTDPNIP